VLARYEQAGGKTARARLIVDREGMAAPFLRDLAEAGHIVVTLLKTNQYEGLTSFTDVGEFVPLTYDRTGQVIREVAQACFALALADQKDQVLPLQVALIRDLRRQVPCAPAEADPHQDSGVPAWWRENWQAEPTKAEPTTAKLIPIVTTAPHIDAVELAQTYIRRWPVQENVIRDYLLPLGLEIVCAQMTKTREFAVGGGRDHVADLDLFIGDDHAIDKQFDQLAFVFKAGLL